MTTQQKIDRLVRAHKYWYKKMTVLSPFLIRAEALRKKS